jgi:hypothetical protein
MIGTSSTVVASSSAKVLLTHAYLDLAVTRGRCSNMQWLLCVVWYSRLVRFVSCLLITLLVASAIHTHKH